MAKRVTLLCLALLAFAPPLAAAAQGMATADQYSLDFSDTASRRVGVRAELTVVGGRAFIESYTPENPGFWRSLIQDLRATDSAGAPLTIDSVSPTSWLLANRYAGRATLTYSVDYSFAAKPFPSGNQKGGLLGARSLYLVTRPLFITPDTGDANSPRLVSVRLPRGWRVATPWLEVPGNPSAYVASGRHDLAVNSLVAGRFATSHAAFGQFGVTAAFIGEMAKDSLAVTEAFAKIARQYFALFPETGKGHYLMTMFYADHDDGEAFFSSATITFGHRVAGGAGILFNNKIAHELLHYWIGQRLRGADHERMGWFSEGFTEYLANRTIQRVGLISDAEYLEKLSRHIGVYSYYWYSPLFAGRSLYDGGEDKTANRFGVYDGGAVAGLCLDLMLRRATANRRGIDDVMQLLWRRNGMNRTPLTLDDLGDAFVSVGGREFADFIPRYITGHDLLPYEELLGQAGVRVRAWPLSAEAYLDRDPNATPAARAAMRSNLLGPLKPGLTRGPTAGTSASGAAGAARGSQ
jgi:predicted metalloprotease with PDZ domain